MSIYQWLCFFGVDAIIGGVIVWVVAMIKKDRADRKAMKLGLQAILRAMMIAEYNKWEDRGFAPIYARQNFENCWEQYHALGANGVMDDIHLKFLQLPTEKPEGGQH